MFMMFIYVDDKIYNSMGIRGDLDELYKQAEEISQDIFKLNPKSEVKTRIMKYI
jgi:hypothetical protein